ncbi:MAG: hypothetical protein ACTSUK_07180 [Promethearchaeota archaeon]
MTKKTEITRKIQDLMGTSLGSVKEIDEAVFLNDQYPLYDKIKHLAKITETEGLKVIQYALERVRNFGLNQAVTKLNDRTRLSAFLRKKKKISKKGHGSIGVDDVNDNYEY